jgi:hypothetical protein
MLRVDGWWLWFDRLEVYKRFSLPGFEKWPADHSHCSESTISQKNIYALQIVLLPVSKTD